MRISEEKDRRTREEAVLSRLTGALDELYRNLSECIADYNEGFKVDVHIDRIPDGLAVNPAGVNLSGDPIQVTSDTELPGFQVKRGDQQFPIVVGVLPGKNLFYRDPVQDKYLTLEELTKRILDRTLFPKLPE